jgi:hypothetical protein
VTVPSVAPPKSVITASTSAAGAETRAVEELHTQATVYGKMTYYTLLLLFIITSSIFVYLYNMYICEYFCVCVCVFFCFFIFFYLLWLSLSSDSHFSHLSVIPVSLC